MNILIIAEDFTYDQYILQPLIEAMLKYLGKSKVKISVCRNPALRGVTQALDPDIIKKIVNQYPMVDLFLLCVDRDGVTGRKDILAGIEKMVADLSQRAKKQRLLGEHAIEEIEVWALAGLEFPDKPEWIWKEIRREIHPKEKYFQSLVRERHLEKFPFGGYKQLGEASARNYPRMRQLCAEDIQRLEGRIQEWLFSGDQSRSPG